MPAPVEEENVGEKAAKSATPGGPASAPRRTRVGFSTPVEGSSPWTRAAQLRAVGGAFLRARPLLVLPVALANGALLLRSGAPVAQRLCLGGSLSAVLALFFAERALLARRELTERWLRASLVGTVLALALGAALSGGAASPFLPLLLAPVVVAFAAFGRRGAGALVLGLAVALSMGLALLPRGVPFAPLAPESARWMTLVCWLGAALLAYAGVAGLAEAYDRSAQSLEALRLATVEEAAHRLREREEVSARVAHELKNPLAALKALLQLLGEGPSEERTARRVRVALEEAERMSVLVEQYLAYARPLTELERAPAELRALAEQVCAVFEAKALRAGVALRCEGDAGRCAVDPRRMREVLVNLLGNALEHSPRGGSVRVLVREEDGFVRVQVRDSGPGLPKGLARPLGTPFVSAREGGTGLGLAVARALVEQHGGTLALADAEGGGAAAELRVPVEEVPR